VREALASAFPSGGYGLAIVNQLVLPPDTAKILVDAMLAIPNDATYIVQHIDALLGEAKVLRKAAKAEPATRPAQIPAMEDLIGDVPDSEQLDPVAESLHSKIQAELIELGLSAGCSVWIAGNDRNRMHQGKRLGIDCLERLPSLGLSPEAIRRIALIDIIWFRHQVPVYAFEVETTTSIYSGLLRMSDLLASVPTLKLNLFVVAPAVRQPRFLAELGRPTFYRSGLSDYCTFVSAEALEELLSKTSGLTGHLEPSIIETIKVATPASRDI
jgi:hypothetical protein